MTVAEALRQPGWDGSLKRGAARSAPEFAERLECGRVLPRRKFTAKRAAEHLRALLEPSDTTENARHVAEKVAREDGAAAAARIVGCLLESR